MDELGFGDIQPKGRVAATKGRRIAPRPVNSGSKAGLLKGTSVKPLSTSARLSSG